MSLQNFRYLADLKTRRKLWLQVHLWLGLILGLLLAIYGVTGSILVFHAEINDWLNSEMRTVKPPEQGAVYRPLAEIFEAGRAAMPEEAKLAFATYPRNDEAAFIQSYSLEKPDGTVEDWQVHVDPYTAGVTGKRLMGDSESWLPNTFIGFVFKLHYALMLPKGVSPVVVGVSGMLLIISVLTGLIVWWPLTGRWLQALTIKRKSSPERFNFDLHKTAGFYTTLVMIPVLFSGVYMVLPHNVVPVLELFSPVTYRYWFESKPIPDREPISMAEAIVLADRRYPHGRAHWIYGAPDPTDTYTVCKDDVDRPGSWLQRVCVVMDRYTGEYLDIDDPAIGTAGEVFTHWQWPLHSGQAIGMAGRILVFLTGLACPVIVVTGVIRWLQKRKAAQRMTGVANRRLRHQPRAHES
ncbi:PepSY-associated TM helix domain-containing protein [Methylocaldum marinum]|uniref:PepSY-associated TM helix domain-containing protein n=1 Tax=Methylocaldum marinum TaxID=1432792 RepID=A0A286P3D3_9GAMM|nr:PepSY-associated TM helix domain-containing protein [Methylocaldum marinum]BBA32155.1 PepSY-associated TM helix domain-containing protein [Methylocaldum marinum]